MTRFVSSKEEQDPMDMPHLTIGTPKTSCQFTSLVIRLWTFLKLSCSGAWFEHKRFCRKGTASLGRGSPGWPSMGFQELFVLFLICHSVVKRTESCSLLHLLLTKSKTKIDNPRLQGGTKRWDSEFEGQRPRCVKLWANVVRPALKCSRRLMAHVRRSWPLKSVSWARWS